MSLNRSTMANDVVKSVYGSFVPVLKEEKLTMRILVKYYILSSNHTLKSSISFYFIYYYISIVCTQVDHSIIEGFGQGGRTCITSRVYPTEATYGAAKLFLFNNAFNATITASFEVWQMNSAFIRPYSAADLVLLHNSS